MASRRLGSVLPGVSIVLLAACNLDIPPLASAGGGDGTSASATSSASGTGGAPTTYADEVRRDDPLVHFRLEEPKLSPEVADATGHGFIGRVKGMVGLEEEGVLKNEPMNHAARFAGMEAAPGYVEIDYPVFAFEGDADFTFEAWLEQDATQTLDASLLGYISGDEGYLLSIIDEKITLRREGTPKTCDLTVTKGTWHHVVVVYASSNFSCIVDGVASVPVAFDKRVTRPSMVVPTIGYGWKSFNGVMDEIAIYDKPLSYERAKAHYEKGLGR